MLTTVRLEPGEDLYRALVALVAKRRLRAGCIVTCVGSLTRATLRMANASKSRKLAGPFEIVSLVGTLAPDGIHVHIALSDAGGRCVGGHLLEGCEIYTTAEIVVAESEQELYARPHDPATGYGELKVSRRPRRRAARGSAA